MAFNPFSAFQKNQKFWMAAILLVTMVTFVFCTGTGGDMQDRLLRLFGKRGPAVATVGGYRLTYEDLARLRSDRNSVNEYMRTCCEMTIKNLDKMQQEFAKKPLPTEEKKKQEFQKELTKLSAMQLYLGERLRKPRFFEGGVKLDDLIEFKIWQTQADRLGIKLGSAEVMAMFRSEFFSPREAPILGDDQMNYAAMTALRGKDSGDRNLDRALAEEYRVRLAQLAIIEMQAGRFRSEIPLGTEAANQERAHVTPAQLWNVYKEKRAEFDVTLIPINVDDFTKEASAKYGPPSQGELERLFERFRTSRYDPASPLPSFETPVGVKVEFLMADPTSPIYVAAAKARAILAEKLPLAGAPLVSPVATAIRYGATAAAKEKALEDVLAGLSRPKVAELYRTADLAAPHFIWQLAAHFAQHDPRAIASLIGNVPVTFGNASVSGVPAWTGFLGEAMARHGDAIDAGIAAEAKRRTIPYATVAASGAIGQPASMVAADALALKLGFVQGSVYSTDLMTLPLPVIAGELENVLERRTAEHWASRNLLTVKAQLDKSVKPEAKKRVINEVVPKYNLTHVVTKDYYTRYNIAEAPEVQPLKASFDRYAPEINWFEKRDITPERMLKDADFYKLFFDNERFASGSKYQVRPWPPEVFPNPMQIRTMPGADVQAPNIPGAVLADVQRAMQLQDPNRPEGYKLLDKAEKPILFWRVDDKPADFPQDVAAARDRVIAAWSTEKARELKAIPLARKIADQLAKTGGDFNPQELQKASSEAGHTPIVLTHIAPLVPKQVGEPFKGGHRDYVPYELPRDTIAMPREDMVADLLNLYNPKAAIEVKTGLKEGEPTFVKMLNDLNKSLYTAVKNEKNPQGKFVQVLTNKPQTVYYVAVITRPPTADLKDFQGNVIAFASDSMFRFVDSFATRAQELVARDVRQRLLAQIREEVGYTAPDEEQRKNFDGSDHGG